MYKKTGELYNTPNIEREIKMLYSLGLNSDEINYLVHLKQKQEISSKWEN